MEKTLYTINDYWKENARYAIFEMQVFCRIGGGEN